jgi:hypothetical protein
MRRRTRFEYTKLVADRNKMAFGWAVLALSAVLLFALATPHAAAQGCAMCYQNASASGDQGRAALRHGILVLLLPALSLFLGVCGLIYRSNNMPR